MTEQTFSGILAKVNIPASVTHTCACEGERKLHTFRLNWQSADATANGAPTLSLSWFKPIIDIQYQWHPACSSNRALQPNWGRAVQSKLSSSCPIHCFYNDAGLNRYTVALSDCTTLISRRMGVREEDATLELEITIPLDATGNLTEYEVTLWLDETDCRYEDAIRAVSEWWERTYPPMPVPDAARLPLYSCWYSFHQNVIAAEVEAECARAAAMGMTTVIVDDGWQTDDNSRGYAYCGDWRVTPNKIPDMRAHVAAVHALGLKYMLWYSVPFVGRYSEAIKRFEGKTLYYREDSGAYTLDPRYPEVRQYLIDIYVRALREWDLDGFKLDFIDSFRMTEESPAYREGMDYVVLEDAVHRLMADVMNALRAIKYDILIEFRQSYIGPAIRGFGNMLRVGDCPNATSVNRVGIVDLRLTSGRTAVHSDMLMWHSEDRVESAVCQLLNTLFGVVQVSVRLDRVPDEHIRAIRFWLDFMKEHRDLLLDAPLYADSPQTLYPLVRAQKDGRSIVACYQRCHVVGLLASQLSEAYVINACAANSMLIDVDSAADWSLTTYDCTGAIVRREDVTLCGPTRVAVPECGMLHLVKK